MADQITYAYKAITPSGSKKHGRMVAENEQMVVRQLAEQGLVPVEITEKELGALASMTSNRTIKVKKDRVATFARQLHLMLRAGLSVSRAVEALGEDDPDPKIALMCRDISEKTLAGIPLSKALGEYPRVFDDVFCSYVAAGEEAGTLPKSVERLAKVLDQQQKLRIKIKAVTAYPKMVAIAIGVMVIGILTFLVPKYAEIYKSFGAELPAPTQAMVNLSSIIWPLHLKFQLAVPPIWAQDDMPIWVSPINFLSPLMWGTALVLTYRWWRKRHKDDLHIGMAIERIKFRMPLVGKLTKYSVLYRWASTMAGAIEAGLQMTSALELAGRTADSDWIKLVTQQAVVAIQSGRSLPSELAKHPDLFFSQIRALASTGEETGEPGEMFQHISDTLEDEIEALVAVLGAKIEVALLMVMGAVVGTMLIILYLPILNLSKVAGEGYSKGGGG